MLFPRDRLSSGLLTPLINKPKLSGNLIHLGPKLVIAGSHKLPGASFLIVPSAISTNSNVKEDNIPIKEVIDRNLKGRKVVGNILSKRGVSTACRREQKEGEVEGRTLWKLEVWMKLDPRLEKELTLNRRIKLLKLFRKLLIRTRLFE